MNTHRLIRLTAVVTFALVLFGVTHPALAQRVTSCDSATPNNAVCLTIQTPSTTATDGSALTGVTYRWEQKFGSGSYSTVLASTTSLQFYAKNLAVGTYTFRAFANCSGCVESDSSNAVTGTSTVKPNAPVIIIAATIRADGPPTYKIIQSYNPKENEIVFVAPSSMRPLFAAR